MELEELIREYEEGIALEMYHEMVDYIDNHGADITECGLYPYEGYQHGPGVCLHAGRDNARTPGI